MIFSSIDDRIRSPFVCSQYVMMESYYLKTINEIIDKINQIHDQIEAAPLHSELRILDWIVFLVCGNEVKRMVNAQYNILKLLKMGPNFEYFEII